MRFAREQRRRSAPLRRLDGGGYLARSAEYTAEGQLHAVSTAHDAPASLAAPQKHQLTTYARRANQPTRPVDPEHAALKNQVTSREVMAEGAASAVKAVNLLLYGARAASAPLPFGHQVDTAAMSGRPQLGPWVSLGLSPARRGLTRQHTSPGISTLPRRSSPRPDSPPRSGSSPGERAMHRCMWGLPLELPLLAAGVPEGSERTAYAAFEMCIARRRTSFDSRSFAIPGALIAGYTDLNSDWSPCLRMYGECRLYRAEYSLSNFVYVFT